MPGMSFRNPTAADRSEGVRFNRTACRTDLCKPYHKKTVQAQTVQRCKSPTPYSQHKSLPVHSATYARNRTYGTVHTPG